MLNLFNISLIIPNNPRLFGVDFNINALAGIYFHQIVINLTYFVLRKQSLLRIDSFAVSNRNIINYFVLVGSFASSSKLNNNCFKEDNSDLFDHYFVYLINYCVKN